MVIIRCQRKNSREIFRIRSKRNFQLKSNRVVYLSNNLPDLKRLKSSFQCQRASLERVFEVFEQTTFYCCRNVCVGLGEGLLKAGTLYQIIRHIKQGTRLHRQRWITYHPFDVGLKNEVYTGISYVSRLCRFSTRSEPRFLAFSGKFWAKPKMWYAYSHLPCLSIRHRVAVGNVCIQQGLLLFCYFVHEWK